MILLMQTKMKKGIILLFSVANAEVLLTYAEAKIEANDIDKSVVDALNEVRNGRDDVKAGFVVIWICRIRSKAPGDCSVMSVR